MLATWSDETVNKRDDKVDPHRFKRSKKKKSAKSRLFKTPQDYLKLVHKANWETANKFMNTHNKAESENLKNTRILNKNWKKTQLKSKKTNFELKKKLQKLKYKNIQKSPK